MSGGEGADGEDGGRKTTSGGKRCSNIWCEAVWERRCGAHRECGGLSVAMDTSFWGGVNTVDPKVDPPTLC